jgi:hypothetical protein
VTVDGASIWSAPTIPSIVLATVKVGTVLDVLAQGNAWYRVVLPGDPTRSGYIQVRQVESAPDRILPPGARAPVQARDVVKRPPRRAYLSVSGGYVPAPVDFDTSATFTKNVEEGTLDVVYDNQRTPLFDVGYGIEINGGLFFAVGVSYVNGTSDVTIEQQVPHPFFFDKKRTVTGTVTGLQRDELALHLQAAWVQSISQRIQIQVAGGPTLFRLEQTFVTDVNYTEEYPFDTAEFDSAVTEKQDKVRWGANAQLNVVVMLNRQVSIDGLVRYSRATVPFEASDGSTFDAAAGGLQVGAGLRFQF